MTEKEKKGGLSRARTKLNQLVPEYAWLPLIFELAYNGAVYGGTKLLAANWHHYNIETSLDLQIPFVPWTIAIYFGCYLFWGVNYILCCRMDRESSWRFLSADFLAKTVCLFFFLAFPTTNTRPEVTGSGIWNSLMRFLYEIDSAENLFPSIHCLVSWLCYIGLRGRSEVPKAYRIFSCVFAIAVFISTLTTKQHVLVDVAGGVLLTELSYWIVSHTGFSRCYGRAVEWINLRVFGHK